MKKIEKETVQSLSIVTLKQYGFLRRNGLSGSVLWGYSKITIEICTSLYYMPDPRITFKFEEKDCNGIMQNFHYYVNLAKSPCNLGGYRYWFICPIIKNGEICERRVGMLYKFGH